MLAVPVRLLGILGISLNPLTLAKDLAKALGLALLGSVGKGATALVRALLGFITSTSDPSFGGGWWSSAGIALFERVVAVTGSLLALAFMFSTISAVLSGDRSLLARAFIRLPVAVLQIALVVSVTGALVAASDQVAAEISRGATTNLSRFVTLDMISAITGSGIVGLVCGGLVILAALTVWAELLVRSALIYLAVLTAPLVFAAAVHPSASGLKRRYIEGALALISSKIVIALAFATGSAMLSGLGRSPSFATAVGALLEALCVLSVAAFTPFILLRLFIGAEGIIAAEGLARRPARSAIAATGMAQTASGASTMLRGLRSSGGGPNGSGPDSGGPSTSGPGGRGPGSGGSGGGPGATPPPSRSASSSMTSQPPPDGATPRSSTPRSSTPPSTPPAPRSTPHQVATPPSESPAPASNVPNASISIPAPRPAPRTVTAPAIETTSPTGAALTMRTARPS